MNDLELRQNVSQNIIEFRKRCDMTQADLAEKLSYSDKSVSKWERGDGVPDIYVLARMAELFGVTVNDIIGTPGETPKPAEPEAPRPAHHLFVSALSIGLVWFIAVVAFFIGRVAAPDVGKVWLAFIYAAPISAVVMTVFAHLWWPIFWRAFSVSFLVWSFAVCFHLTAQIPNLSNINLIYTVAAAFEVLVVVWYIYIWTKKRAKNSVVAQSTSAEKASATVEKASAVTEKASATADRVSASVKNTSVDAEKSPASTESTEDAE